MFQVVLLTIFSLCVPLALGSLQFDFGMKGVVLTLLPTVAEVVGFSYCLTNAFTSLLHSRFRAEL